MSVSTQVLAESIKTIRLLICDVDGVLTDGQLSYSEPFVEHKSFHVHDGLGLKLLLENDIQVAIITARKSEMVRTRMQQLGIQLVYQGVSDKLPVFESIIGKMNLAPKQVAYIGDDLPDLALIKQAGLGITVANAPVYIKEAADWQTSLAGGQGAVREVCDLLLTGQGKMSNIISGYSHATLT